MIDIVVIGHCECFNRTEETHQDYFEKNPTDAYCQMYAAPTVEKVRERFKELIAES